MTSNRLTIADWARRALIPVMLLVAVPWVQPVWSENDALLAALSRGDLGAVEQLLASGADPNATDTLSTTWKTRHTGPGPFASIWPSTPSPQPRRRRCSATLCSRRHLIGSVAVTLRAGDH